MLCSREAFLRFGDSFLLAVVFLFQSVILNYVIINHFRQSSFPFLLFLADFMCLLVFSFTLYLAYRAHCRDTKRPSCLRGSTSLNSSRNSSRTGHRSETSHDIWPPSFHCCSRLTKMPFSYIAWMVYSIMIIFKIVFIFKAGIPRSLSSDAVIFKPEIIKVAVACAALIFSLLVEAHSDANHNEEPIRNAYIKSISYGMAMEILDSVSFLSLLIVSESHLIYTFQFENFILGLSSVNLMLPAIALYKLTVSGFGVHYPLPLEIIYKLLHLGLVNVPYLCVRLYLWQWYAYSDTSIFIVKNVYSICSLLRSVYPDLVKACSLYRRKPRVASLQNIDLNDMGGRDGSPNGETSLNGSKPTCPLSQKSVEEIAAALHSYNANIKSEDPKSVRRNPSYD